MNTRKEHIGDGVYASFDGWQIWLEVDRGGTPETIALEPHTFDALIEYRKRIMAELAKEPQS